MKERTWHDLFEAGVLIKSLNGLWELVSGSFFLFVSDLTLNKWFYFIVRNEIIEDPKDRLITFLAAALQSFSHDARIFAAFYLLIHGFINIFLAIELYKERYWAYLLSIALSSLSLAYQLHRIELHHSIILTIISIFDVFFIILTWHEYKHRIEKERAT